MTTVDLIDSITDQANQILSGNDIDPIAESNLLSRIVAWSKEQGCKNASEIPHQLELESNSLAFKWLNSMLPKLQDELN